MLLRREVMIVGVAASLISGMFVAHVVSAQRQDAARSAAADWPTYNRDLAGTRYSPLTQITQTGTLKWHFQNIRHELWDYKLPPAPGLIEIRKDGKTIPALAQVGKPGPLARVSMTRNDLVTAGDTPLDMERVWTVPGRAVKGTQLKQVILVPQFWFAWSQFHQGTGVFTAR